MSRTILALLGIFIGILTTFNAQAATVYPDLASWEAAIPYLAPAVEVPLTWPTGTIVPWGSTFVSATGNSYVQVNGYGDSPESAWSPDGTSVCVQTGIGGDPRIDFGLYNAVTSSTITTNVIAMEVTATSPTATLEPGSSLSGTGAEWTTASQGFLGMTFVDSSYYYYIIDYTRKDTLCVSSLWIVEDTDDDGNAGDLDCDEVDNDGDGSDACTDCDDTFSTSYPGAPEYCNGIDDDCDGSIDEGVTTTFYRDADSDGYGHPTYISTACTAPTGYVSNNTDCDDMVASVNPGATEYCDGHDDDCDGVIDEDTAVDASTWYRDADGDGYGDASNARTSCSLPTGYVSDDTDCSDANATTYPGATEYCNGVDDNCDGVIDENTAVDASTWYRDTDGDGYGDSSRTDVSCSLPSGYVSDDTDCDDTNASAHPSATEYCNGVDDNCDGVIDEDTAVDASTWYRDADSDGYGHPTYISTACTAPTGYVSNNTDCDDMVASVNPGATEYCDGHDDDCDNSIDEDNAADALTWYLDADEDGYGVDTDTTTACDEPSGYSELVGDCNDADPAFYPGAPETDCKDPNDYNCDGSTGHIDADADGHFACEECDDSDDEIYPGATEYCNGVDDNCDGVIDEDTAVDASIWYLDADVDGYGNPSSSVMACYQPSGYVGNDDDCNDGDLTINPGYTDACGDGVDQDCDGIDPECDTGDTDDTGIIDPPDPDSGDTASKGYWVGGGGCGTGPNGPNCSTSGASPTWLGLFVGLLALVRRRR